MSPARRAAIAKLATLAGERHRALQAAIGTSTLACGVGWVASPGWAFVVVGALLLVDVAITGLPQRKRRTP